MHENQLLHYIQYGCGYTSNPEGWFNFDASPTLYLQRIPIISCFTKKIIKPLFPDNVQFGDILRELPIPEESCKGIYCSHVLEHLSLEDFRKAVKNTYYYLVPDGIFRLVMPDLYFLVQQYLTLDDPQAAIYFLEMSLLGVNRRERSLINFSRNYLGNSRHLWLWDFNSTKNELEKIGFRNIRRAKFGDSQDPKFCEIEEESRWENCLGIECQK
jgi:SAM-dependent methyltransferase